MGKVKAGRELLETGIVSLVKRPVGKHIRTEEQRLAQSLRSQKQGEKKDTFRHEGKTYLKSEGVKAFYKTDRIRSGIGYSWVPKSVRGGKGGGTGIPQQVEEKKLIKAKLQELDVESLKGMYAPELVKYIKDTLNIVRTPSALQKSQQEVIGGGWKIGKGQRGSAGPDHFTYRGKVYPKSEGVQTTYTNKDGSKYKSWFPKEVKGTVGKHKNRYMDPALIAERESIRTAFEKMDKKILKRMTGNELLVASNKIPGVNRNTIPYDIREQVIGGGWKPKKGRTLVEGQLARFSGINTLSPENYNKVGEFMSTLTQAYPGKKATDLFFPIVDRMVKFAKRKGVPEEQIIKKLYGTDIEGIGDIIIKKHELRKLYQEAKELGLKPEMIDLSHIEAVSRNWEKALDPSNLFFANYKSNRYLQKAIEEQINILRNAIPKAKSLADKKMLAKQKMVLDPTKRKEHMYKYYKPRTLAEAREELAGADLVSEIGGTRRGAKIDPKDPYFAEKMAAQRRAEIARRREEINLQAAHTTLNRGGIVNGYGKGGYTKKLLDDALGMMSRRKFLKGMGATAASAAMPKSLVKFAPAAIKKGAVTFAPPWVNGMLSALKSVPVEQSLMRSFNVGNNAKIQKLGSKKIKVYKDQTATETYFKVKTSDQVKTEEMVEGALPGIKKQDQFWDDIILREEKGETTITWKSKAFDEGNDQHIIIDKINQETRFVDDNWHMEAGGEDIAKDDWIEWAITPNKSEIAVALKKPRNTIDDWTVDGYSVRDMDNQYSGMFESFVDSFSPSGNVFGTVERMTKAIKKKALLRREKMYNDEQVRALKEKEMMEWEGQFRGGKGIHGFDRGGINFAGRRQENNPQRPTMDFNKVLDAIAMQESSNNPQAVGPLRRTAIFADQSSDRPRERHEKAHGLFQILPSTARQPGYGVTPFRNFGKNWQDKKEQRRFAGDYMQAMLKNFDNDYEKAISAYFYGPGNVEAGDYDLSTYYDKVMGHYNKGGIARRPNAVPPTSGPDPYATFIEDSIGQMKTNPSEFMGSQFIQKFNKGGFVKRTAPAVIGKLTNYKPKLTMSDVLKNIQKAKKTKIKPTLKSMEPKAEKPGALFWGSREKIIGAPSEAMTGLQWLQYMKIGKHGILNPKGYPRIKDMELNDTSLAPWLSRQGNKTVSKEVLVKQFDDMAPKMEVTVLGEATGGRIFDDMRRTLEKIDTQAIRNPAIKGFYDYIKAVLPQLRSSQTGKGADEIAAHINAMVERNFGVPNALEAGVPQRFPFEIKELLQQISTGLGKRTAGFKTYRGAPEHRGTQTMSGGDNYREFLFRYIPGSLRKTEPQYKYAHGFGLSDADRMGGVVHTRTSDRADQFGRRLLHIEEIQADMHQKVNAAQRAIKKQIADWEKEGLKPHEAYLKLSSSKRKEFDKLTASSKYAPRGDLQEEIATANEQHLALVKAKIEDLLTQKQTTAIRTRIARLNKERTKVRKMIADEKAKMAEGKHSGVPQGPLSKTEDYNEFIMKYLLRVAREGGYDGITINTSAIKNLGMTPTGRDFKGNLVAYGPMAQGAMKKAAKKSGAKFMKTVIVDGKNRAWEVPMILIKENKAAQALIDKGLPIYKKGGIVKK